MRRSVTLLWRALVPVLVLAAGCALAASSSGTQAAAGKTEIRIGMTVSTTGSYAFASEQGFKGVQIWVDDVNSRQGGIYVRSLGKRLPVKLIYLEDRSDKQQVTRLYERLITNEKIDIAFAPFGSTLTGAAAAVTEKYKMPLIIWSAASDSIYSQGYKYVVSATQVAASLMPKPHVEHMKDLGIKKVGIIYLDEPFPAGQAQGMKDLSEQAGLAVVHFEKYSKDTLGYTTLLQKVKQSGAEALYVTGYMEEQVNILRQMKELNLMFPYVFMNYSGQPEWGKLTGKDGLFIFGHTLFHPELRWPVTDGLTVDQVLERYQKLFPDAKNPADFQTSLAYGAGVLLQKFIETAGSLDPDAIRKAAADLSSKVTVVTGPYVIDETGKQLGMPFVVTQVAEKNGEYYLNLLWPKEVANAEPVYPIPGWDQR